MDINGQVRTQIAYAVSLLGDGAIVFANNNSETGLRLGGHGGEDGVDLFCRWRLRETALAANQEER